MNCVIQAWAEHEAELRGYLRRQLDADAATAEDLLQDTFLRAVKQGARFCELENPRAWLYRVARGRLIDHQRRMALRSHVALDDQIPEPDESPQAVKTLDVCLPVALQHLSAADRIVIEQCDLEGQSQVEFADAQGLTLPAVKSRIQRARTRLKTRLDQLCGVRYDEQGQVCCHQSSPIDS